MLGCRTLAQPAMLRYIPEPSGEPGRACNPATLRGTFGPANWTWSPESATALVTIFYTKDKSRND